MIRNIHIENFALIKNQTILFKSGLNIITGETGSGKSILAAAIAGIFGEDISNQKILHGEDKLKIQCEITLNDAKCAEIMQMTDIESEDGVYVISRIVQGKGKNSIRLNGDIISLNTLKQIGESIFDFHTQNETKELLKRENQIKLLDQFSENGFKEKYEYFRKLYQENLRLEKKLLENQEMTTDNETRKDILKYQINEIEKGEVTANEYEDLVKRKDILINSEKIIRSLTEISKTIEVENIRKISKEFEVLSNYYDEYANIIEELSDMYWKLKDIQDEVNMRIANIEYDPIEIDQIVSRIDILDRLRKKYGSTYKEILTTLKNKRNELEELENINISTKNIESRIKLNKYELLKINSIILNYRKKAAEKLCEKIVTELKDLDMENIKFEVRFKRRALGINGDYEVRFVISTNKGQPLRYLDEISSGGEMARVMLVFKKLISSFDETDILVFDEIESGVSGATAFRLGQKIFDISLSRQVICITHIPQITVFSKTHFQVLKIEDHGVTFSVVRELGEKQKENEVAKLLGSKMVTKNTLVNAQELISAGEDYYESGKK